MANYTARSIEEIEKYIIKITIDEIINFGEQVRKALKQELKAVFYGRAGFSQDQSGTDYYTRTWQLLDSIEISPVKKNGNQISVQIFYNTGKMSTISGSGDTWSTHESIIDGNEFREALPEVIEYGNPSKIYGWEAFHIVENLRDRLADDHAILQWFESAFKKRGFNVIAV